MRQVFNDLPPWAAVYQKAQRWLAAACFEALANDLRAVLRPALCQTAQPRAAILDNRTLRFTPESGTRGGYDGAERGFVLLARRWVIERSFAWTTRSVAW